MGSTTSNGVFNENKKMTKEPKLPHKLKWGDRTAARVDEVEYLIGISGLHVPKRRDYSRGARKCSGRGRRVAHAREFNERRWIRIHGEAASRGTLQVYKT